MPEGVIVGGWNFVLAAYSVTFVVLIGHFVSMWRRERQLEREGRQDD